MREKKNRKDKNDDICVPPGYWFSVLVSGKLWRRERGDRVKLKEPHKFMPEACRHPPVSVQLPFNKMSRDFTLFLFVDFISEKNLGWTYCNALSLSLYRSKASSAFFLRERSILEHAMILRFDPNCLQEFQFSPSSSCSSHQVRCAYIWQKCFHLEFASSPLDYTINPCFHHKNDYTHLKMNVRFHLKL